MNLNQIEYFLKLAELESFKQTAEVLYVSQPAVSKQISLLEKEWGFSLFERGYKTARLTPAGKMMADMLKNASQQYEQTLRLAWIRSRQSNSVIRIGLPEYAIIGNLFELLTQFQREHPDIELNVYQVPLSELGTLDEEAQFDITVEHERNLRNKENVDSVTLARRRHVAYVSPHLPAIQKSNPVFEDLKDTPVFVPTRERDSITTDIMLHICKCHGFTPSSVTTIPYMESILSAAHMGSGFIVLDDLLELPKRFCLLQIPTSVFFDIKLTWRSNLQKRPLQQLIAFLLDNIHVDSTDDTCN